MYLNTMYLNTAQAALLLVQLALPTVAAAPPKKRSSDIA